MSTSDPVRDHHFLVFYLFGRFEIQESRTDHDHTACPLDKLPSCTTLSYMKASTLTIRLDKDLEKLLNRVSKQSGKSKSEVAREALQRQLRLVQFESLRRKTMPFAEARGYLNDDDVFEEIS